MKRVLFLSVVCLLWGVGHSAAQSSQPGLRFEKTRHDFGTIAERDGAVSCTFRFTNTADRPLVIEDILTTCGCTVAEWDKRPILPGQGGAIRVRFDPRGRTETFHKSVRVVADRGRSVVSLFVCGTILLEETPDEHLYELFDDLFVDRLTLSFGTLQRNVPRSAQQLTLHNRGSRSVRLGYGIDPDSGCLRVVMPARIEPGASARIAVEAVDRPGYRGTLRADVRLVADGVAAELPVSVFGFLVDDLRSVPIDGGPRCEVRDGYFNFGRIPCGSACSHDFTLRNTGRMPLVVRRIESRDPVRTDPSGERTLQPGESLRVSICVDTGAPASVDADIHIISNDVRTPVRRIKVEGEIIR